MAEHATTGFIDRLQRLVSLVPGRPRRDADELAIERAFLSTRRYALEREVRRRVDSLVRDYPGSRQAILRYAEAPLSDEWRDGELPRDIAYQLRPLHRELDVLTVLDGAIEKRPLRAIIDGVLRRIEEEVMSALQAARPGETYGDSYWSDELLEQIMSHLLHLWAEWLHHLREAGPEAHP